MSDVAAPQTLEEAFAQFDAYKAKTREWQAKVKDRDAKLRTQLQIATEQVREQEQKLEQQANEVCEARKRIESLEAMEAALRDARDQNAEAVNCAVATVTAEYQLQLASRQAEVVKLRKALEEAEREKSHTRRAERRQNRITP